MEELETEIWDFETGNNWTFEQSLLPTGLVDGIALYFVDANFCNSSDDVVCDDLSHDCHDWSRIEIWMAEMAEISRYIKMDVRILKFLSIHVFRFLINYV